MRQKLITLSSGFCSEGSSLEGSIVTEVFVMTGARSTVLSGIGSSAVMSGSVRRRLKRPHPPSDFTLTSYKDSLQRKDTVVAMPIALGKKFKGS